MHSIGAEDVKAEGYPYDGVARAWQGMKKRRRSQCRERKAPEDKDGRKRKGTANTLLGEGDARLDVSEFGSDSGSSVSSFESIARSDDSRSGSRDGSRHSSRDGSRGGSRGGKHDDNHDVLATLMTTMMIL